MGLKGKTKSPEQIAENKEEIDKMWEFFLEIWNERPHYSEASGAYLGEVPKNWMFDHLLLKSVRRDLKHTKGNIFLCTFEEHNNKENGLPHPKHQEAINKAKQQYG